MEKTFGLSTPEAFVLISLPKLDVCRALKLGFMGLLAQGLLRIENEDRPGLIRTRHIAHLPVAPNLPDELPPISASLVKVVRAAEPDGLMKTVVAPAMREYGRVLAGFAVKLVIPSLIARGLAEQRKSRLLGLVPLIRHFRTAAGETVKIRLDGLMRDARSIPSFRDRDPAQAAALVTALGGAVLLVDELRPHYQAIATAMRGHDGGDGGFIDSGSFSDPGGVDFGTIDFGAFDAGAFDRFDAGFSDAGGDGGSSGC